MDALSVAKHHRALAKHQHPLARNRHRMRTTGRLPGRLLRNLTARALALMCVAGLALQSAPSWAATLWTTNSGTDSTSCGSKSSPCRSISQSIANATDGDTIWVGPGRYGDVNGDGTFTGPGDEQPMPSAGEWDGTGCIVCVTKRLHIYSLQGAAVTLIQGKSQPFYASSSAANVMILHDGGDFGSAGHGFTITGGNVYGLEVQIPDEQIGQSTPANMTVVGNVDLGDGTGFYYYGRNYLLRGCPIGDCLFVARLLIQDNRAVNNLIGFNLVPNIWTGPGQVIVRDNEASGGGTCFSGFPGFQGEPGEYFSGNMQFVNNVASNCGVGFYADQFVTMEYNTAIGNSQIGFLLTPYPGALFTNNSALGNAGPGVVINYSPDAFTVWNGQGFARFDQNTFAGNDRSRPALPYGSPAGGGGWTYDAGPSAHCGVLNLGALTSVTLQPPLQAIQLAAGNNYWGSAKGPSASGSGDDAGGVCDQNASTTMTRPYLTTAPASTQPFASP